METLPKAYALITGASQGLGKALAEECARRGMHLLLVALPETGLRALSAEIAARHGVDSQHLELDLTDPSGPEQVARWVAAHGWNLRFLVNNAGASTHGRFEETSLERNELVMDLNMAAVVRTTHLLIPTLRNSQPSYILNVASLAAIGPMPYMPIYAASKAFVLSFTLALREELHRSGIGVSVLCPGGMPTNDDSARRIGANGLRGRLSSVRPERVAGIALTRTLRGRACIIPGALNRIVAVASNFTPRTVFTRSAGHQFERAELRLQRTGGALQPALAGLHGQRR